MEPDEKLHGTGACICRVYQSWFLLEANCKQYHLLPSKQHSCFTTEHWAARRPAKSFCCAKIYQLIWRLFDPLCTRSQGCFCPISHLSSALIASSTIDFLNQPQFNLRSICHPARATIVNMTTQQTNNPTASFHPVTHIIFDCDGLLVDSEQYYSEAISEVANRYGKTFDYQIKLDMMGTKPVEGAIICLDKLGLTGKVKPEDFVTEYESEMKKNYHKIKLMPGAERLIKHLSANHVPISIATGSANSGFDRKTGHIGEILRKPFSHHVFAGSDPEVKRGKPHPDVFEQAARRFKNPPKDMRSVLVFEDAVNGVKAALAAGMQVVFVPDKRLDMSSVSVKPTLILASLEEFKPELFGLPAFAASS